VLFEIDERLDMSVAENPTAPRDGAAVRLLRRWPTAAGILFAAALSAAFWWGLSQTPHAAQVLTAAGVVYLGSAAVGSRRAAWPLFAVTFVIIGAGFAAPAFDPVWAMIVVAVVLVGYGVIRGSLRPTWGMPLQGLAMAVIAMIALGVTLLGEPAAGLVVGAGLLAHAGWDLHHLRSRRVVDLSMAEFCAVLDTILALNVIAVALVR
jgi:hypothetical protein